MRINVRNFTGFAIPESPIESAKRIRTFQNTIRARAAMRAKALRLARLVLLAFALGATIPPLAYWIAGQSFRFSVQGVTKESGLSMSQCLDRWIPFEGTATGVGCHVETLGERLGFLFRSPVMPKRAARFATRNV